MIDAEVLSLLPRGAYLVNTARGAVLDTAAVPAAVACGQLAGVGLDVLESEPPAEDDPLIRARRDPGHPAHHRVVLTPHSAFYSEESRRECRMKAALTWRATATVRARARHPGDARRTRLTELKPVSQSPHRGDCASDSAADSVAGGRFAARHVDEPGTPGGRTPMPRQTARPRISPMARGEGPLRGLSRSLAGAAVLGVLGAGVAEPQAMTLDRPNSFTLSPLTGLHEPVVEALLYNPPVDEVTWRPLDGSKPFTKKHEASLVISGRGVPDGTYRLTYRVEGGEKVLHAEAGEVSVAHGCFELVVNLSRKYPEATLVAYALESGKQAAIRGQAALRWSRFRGQVKYLDGRWRSTYAELHPEGFTSKSLFSVPIGEDGRFDALVPARVYSVINVNGAGYLRDAMERWAWDYDLTRDREEEFTIGRTELYSIHAFNIVGGPSTVFVAFRPTALSRVLQFDADGDGSVSDEERKATMAAMKRSPTAIGPELQASDVTVWLNGVPQKIAQFDRIPEYDGDFWQVQYLLQFLPGARPAPGIWHEIKVEVRSRESLRGNEMVDFGQGSVGFWRK
jgi:hypothetical protein